MKLSPVASSISLSGMSPARVETPLTVATPFRMSQQFSSYAPVVKAVPSTSYHSASHPSHQVSSCVASVVAPPPITSEPLSSTFAKSSASKPVSSTYTPPSTSASNLPSVGLCSPLLDTRRIRTPDSNVSRRASTGILLNDDTRCRRSSSCMAALARTNSPMMRRSLSPVKHRSGPRTLQSPIMSSRTSLTLPGTLSVPSAGLSSCLTSSSVVASMLSSYVPQGMATSSGSGARMPSLERPPLDRSSLKQDDNTGGLSVEELQYDTPEFDPSVGRCQQKIAAQLGCAPNARCESLMGKAGGMNQGLWALHEPAQALILKLTSCHRHHPMVPTETENFLRLSREYPALLHERGLAFPLKIFRCRGPSGNASHDLIVMRKASGQSFSEVINRKWKKQTSELMQDFDAAGSFLANMHNKYGLQHGDFQPNNLFYDEASKQFTMIDVADLAPSSTMLIQEDDVEHFSKGVRLLARCLGDQLQADGLRYFQAGYNRCRRANC